MRTERLNVGVIQEPTSRGTTTRLNSDSKGQAAPATPISSLIPRLYDFSSRDCSSLLWAYRNTTYCYGDFLSFEIMTTHVLYRISYASIPFANPKKRANKPDEPSILDFQNARLDRRRGGKHGGGCDGNQRRQGGRVRAGVVDGEAEWIGAGFQGKPGMSGFYDRSSAATRTLISDGQAGR